uniref:Reverse transcriptase domain-containing protein n=1 Tax=Tanacetum cinerariifolium TaxID=118510 RepID=A0A6L2L934_TANCI|nr:hypothetical protein [Tanacetum cinerariifolium]
MCEMVGQLIQKKQEKKQIQEDQMANAQYWKIPACYDDDDDYNFAIIPNEPIDSLIMEDEHLNTIPTTESDEFIKSSVEDLVPNPSESEGKNGCNLPACFTTFSNILFDAEYEFDSVNDQSLSDEDFPEEIFSNPLFEEEINSMRIDLHHFNVESDLIESLLNHDSSIIPSSSKIDSLLDEFAGELTLLKSILPGIDETDCHPENEIRLTKRLLYDNSFPQIDSFFNPDDPMPSCIKEDDDDSMDILILKELPSNYSLSLLVNESFHFDIPSSSRPPAKPPDGNTWILKIKMMGDVSDQKVPIPGLTITLVSNQEKSPDLLSHRGLENFQPSAECPMMIHGKNIPILDAAEIVIPEVEEIEDDNLREKLLNVHLLIANIEALKDNPNQSSDCKTKSSSTSLNSLLEETNTFHNSLPEFENFYFDLGEISSGSTTTHSDISLPDYEAFYFDDDHIKEISSGRPTT